MVFTFEDYGVSELCSSCTVTTVAWTQRRAGLPSSRVVLIYSHFILSVSYALFFSKTLTHLLSKYRKALYIHIYGIKSLRFTVFLWFSKSVFDWGYSSPVCCNWISLFFLYFAQLLFDWMQLSILFYLNTTKPSICCASANEVRQISFVFATKASRSVVVLIAPINKPF